MKEVKVLKLKTYPMTSSREYGMHDGNNISFLGEFFYTKKALKLLESDCDSCSSHKPNHRRMREKVYQESQPEKPEAGLENASKESGGESKAEIFSRIVNWIDHGLAQSTNKKRHHSHWSNRNISRTPHACVHQWWHETGVYTQKHALMF